MLLVCDIGNTNMVFGLFEGETLLTQWRAASDRGRTSDELGLWLTQAIAQRGYDAKGIEALAVASVVPVLKRVITGAARDYLGKAPIFFGEGSDIKIPVRLDRPDHVGADRLINALAAHQLYGGPLIVVDFGTATTFDVVGADGGYEGGVIAPGVNLSAEALYQAAARLPRVEIAKPEGNMVLGKSTVPAMQSGLFWGYIGLTEGVIARLKAEQGMTMKVIATGGLATLLAEATQVFDAIDPNLTLTGLRLAYEQRT